MRVRFIYRGLRSKWIFLQKENEFPEEGEVRAEVDFVSYGLENKKIKITLKLILGKNTYFNQLNK